MGKSYKFSELLHAVHGFKRSRKIVFATLVFRILLFTAQQLFCQGQTGPTVNVGCGGQLDDKVITTPKGTCNGFFGIPFAKPPVGGVRWEVRWYVVYR